MRWLRAMLGLHEHKWVVFERRDIYEPGKDMPYGMRFVLRCEQCGNLKKVDI